MTPLPTSVITIPQALALVVAIIASVTDIRTDKIFNWLTIPGALLGIVTLAVSNAVLTPDQPLAAAFAGALQGVGGLLTGILILAVPKMFMPKLGHGDTKLMGALGAFVGVGMILATWLYFCFLYGAFCAGSVLMAFPWRQVAIAYVTRSIKVLDFSRVNEARKRPLPIAPFMALGLLVAIILQHPTLHFMGFER